MGSAVLLLTIAATALSSGDSPYLRTPDLPIAPGAEALNRGSQNTTLAYDVKEPFPAPHTIGYIVDALAKQGWRLYSLGSFRPGLGPTELPTLASALKRTHTWEGLWRNSAGDEITYRLAYECPLEAEGMHSAYVHVVGAWHSKEAATRRDAERKRLLVETCAFLRDWAPVKAKAICGE
jgi:hypothetical protein